MNSLDRSIRLVHPESRCKLSCERRYHVRSVPSEHLPLISGLWTVQLASGKDGIALQQTGIEQQEALGESPEPVSDRCHLTKSRLRISATFRPRIYWTRTCSTKSSSFRNQGLRYAISTCTVALIQTRNLLWIGLQAFTRHQGVSPYIADLCLTCADFADPALHEVSHIDVSITSREMSVSPQRQIIHTMHAHPYSAPRSFKRSPTTWITTHSTQKQTIQNSRMWNTLGCPSPQ